MVSSRSVLKTAWMAKKLQNVQTGPKNYAQIRTDSLFTDTLLWMQSNNDC